MDTNIILHNTYVVTKINRPCSIKAFQDVQVGDYIHFKLPIEYLGYGSGGRTYATYITVTNERTGVSCHKSINVLAKALDCCDFELLLR